MQNLVELRTESSGSFEIDGKPFSWRMVEEWVSTDNGTEVSCRKGGKFSFSKREGISETELQGFKAIAEGQIGLKDVFAIKGGIEKSCSYQLSWFSETTVSTEIVLTPPGCGAEMYVVYQLVRSYYISTVKKRVFRRPVTVDLPTIREKTGLYLARVISEREDERCPCGEEEPAKMLAPFLLTAGKLRISLEGNQVGNDVQFHLGGRSYQASGDFSADIGIELKGFPAFFAALAGYEAEDMDLVATVRADQTDLHQSGFGGDLLTLAGAEAPAYEPDLVY